MSASANLQLENAIGTIRTFLAGTVDQLPGVDAMRVLSRRIQKARESRKDSSLEACDAVSRSLAYAYRECLEQLQSRLRELETRLAAERERCLQSQENVLRVRAWHDVFSQLH